MALFPLFFVLILVWIAVGSNNIAGRLAYDRERNTQTAQRDAFRRAYTDAMLEESVFARYRLMPNTERERAVMDRVLSFTASRGCRAEIWTEYAHSVRFQTELAVMIDLAEQGHVLCAATGPVFRPDHAPSQNFAFSRQSPQLDARLMLELQRALNGRGVPCTVFCDPNWPGWCRLEDVNPGEYHGGMHFCFVPTGCKP